MKADNDNEVHWRGVRIDGLPTSMSEAKTQGETYYLTGKPCVHGHLSPRYAGGACVDCFYEKPDLSTPWSEKLTGAKTIAKITRAAARGRGDKHYIPSRPCRNGHLLRWVSTNNCVQCDAELRDERKEKVRDAYLLKTYGIDQNGRDELASSQGWLCLICNDPLDGGYSMHVDHCHDSGKIRGILCSRCNQAIGLFRDNPQAMRRAAEYVESHREHNNVTA